MGKIVGKSKLKKMVKNSVIACIALSSVLITDIASAASHPGYSYESNIGYHNSNWMSKIENDKKIGGISIPGTHGTMALHGATSIDENLTRNQTMTLSQQLNSGIRYVDMRVRRTKGSFAMHHGIVYQKAMFGDVLRDTIQFLKDNPSETIVMRLKEEHDAESGSKSFEEIFNSYKNSNASYFWDPSSVPVSEQNNPKLKDVRGKIVILQNFSASKQYGIYYDSLNVQDNYEVTGNPDGLYEKWSAVKNHLLAADLDKGNELYLNHFSGTGGASSFINNFFPWFIASGKSSRSTDGNMKLIQSNPTNKWPDFPRGDKGQVYYGGINILGTEMLQRKEITHSGIIAADFPGPGLIDSTIKLNGTQFGEKEVLVATASSEARPLSGQKNRSGQNFKIDNLPVGTKELKWVVEPVGSEQPSNILFNVMIDVSFGTDPVRWSKLSDQSRTEAYTNSKYYIANPSGAEQRFIVKIYAITN
ncbi:phosphatidylinositol-specific phospholipase C [Bacillus thuringiensis]|uniref:phosphatidylinositol-specific phospholipase C n=1 Tax=Bacillus thuringiensis TaxID=1428 RepID=UPI000E5542E2|nr:phosphatidylinositol-specific phospholipase C [Bacillus thuringiensis]MDZ3952422.1 phosphatidylinositol-specific phospholipase C [Bacillus thuringiensis]RGP45239.1 phosphatidylinositol phosphodiesterase [Bacillus thuringiensis]